MYGKPALLFECDCAVRAYHNADEQWQAIFPICSEYGVIPISGEEGSWWVAGEDAEGEEVELNFESIEDIAEAADTKGSRITRSNPRGVRIKRFDRELAAWRTAGAARRPCPGARSWAASPNSRRT